ncbi:transposase family protein [Vibrio sp. 1567]|uniref:transposase family protein n=1 Tax=Vibrio sp. 1567 TaxID=3074564 RepID=UPI0029647360|nr:transposase family protein [Vibrio sp. 1567]MDW2169819.1 transposase family protein [Vibrio sp. 1567]
MQFQTFREQFSMLSDPRQSKKVSYDFFEVLFQVVVSVLCGYKTWDDIEEFGHLNIEWFRQYGGQGPRMLLTHLSLIFWDKILK